MVGVNQLLIIGDPFGNIPQKKKKKEKTLVWGLQSFKRR